jgi:hypothetical protein
VLTLELAALVLPLVEVPPLETPVAVPPPLPLESSPHPRWRVQATLRRIMPLGIIA